MQQRITAMTVMLLVSFALLCVHLGVQMHSGQPLAQAAARQQQRTLTAGTAQGAIYDRRLQPLTGGDIVYRAAVDPTPQAMQALAGHLTEMTPYLRALREGTPFVVGVDTPDLGCADITVFTLPARTQGAAPAQHLLGYVREGTGVTGLEADYDNILRGIRDAAGITYTVDALGHVLPGVPPVIRPAQGRNPGLVTTLDARIQRLCEAQDIAKGAIVVMEVSTGDVLAMASFPSYDPDDLAAALGDPDSPLINRCLCAYSVGSIFKLMTCAAAYEQGQTGFATECTGSTEIAGQLFHCHKLTGHGAVDMKQAMIDSCNTYFIELSTRLDPVQMKETVQRFGYGTQIVLSGSIVSSGGTLPRERDLHHRAEMANFCFGQGLLTATPLQVTQMTCGIAGNGNMPLARLIRGYTRDGVTVEDEKSPMYAHVCDRKAAYYLQDMMIAAINENPDSKAVPDTVFAAAKTSTAQTGRFDADGAEYCHGWITGYFPLDAPQYAVTVLCEDGGYGNDAAAPVFHTLADAIMAQ